jgi:hypothetical protein
MALPAEITKATGLKPALEAIGVSPEETIGVGWLSGSVEALAEVDREAQGR